MTTKNPTHTESLFWQLADQLKYQHEGIEEGRIMSHKCLRINTNFLAMTLTSTDGLVIKLPANRVTELIQTGQGQPFVPNGKIFKEWVLLPTTTP